jgi:hypothetical protein
MNNENYRPAKIEFNVVEDGSNIPPTFGNFATTEEAGKFMAGNMTCINKQMRVARWMDELEKNNLRRDYSELLENLLPVFEKELSQAENALSEAKKKQKSAEDAYTSAVDRAKNMAAEVKRGLKPIDLEAKHTFQVPYKGRYYYFTWIDKQMNLCHVADIPEYEKSDLFNQMAGNEQFIDGITAEIVMTNPAEKGPVYREYKESPSGSSVTETEVKKERKGKK